LALFGSPSFIVKPLVAQVNYAWLITMCDGRSTPENPQVISTGVGGEFLFTWLQGSCRG